MADKSPERIEPLMLDIRALCTCLSIKRATYYKISANGTLGPLPIKLCKKVLYSKGEIERWVQAGCPHRKQWQIQRKEMRP
jgi:predicted DNA-binding transcriptional regulator AlpA